MTVRPRGGAVSHALAPGLSMSPPSGAEAAERITARTAGDRLANALVEEVVAHGAGDVLLGLRLLGVVASHGRLAQQLCHLDAVPREESVSRFARRPVHSGAVIWAGARFGLEPACDVRGITDRMKRKDPKATLGHARVHHDVLVCREVG